MKKIFTLAFGLLMSVALFAADRKPSITVNTSKNYKVVIDGKSYFGNSTISINNLYGGRHTVKVYEMKRGFFGKEKLVDASTFMLSRNDMVISVGRFGNIAIKETKPFNGRFDRDDNGWGQNDHRDDKNSRDNHPRF